MSDTVTKIVRHEIKRQLKKKLRDDFDRVFDKIVFVSKECGCIKVLIKDSDVCITKVKICKLPKMDTKSNHHKIIEYAAYIAGKIVDHFNDHSCDRSSESSESSESTKSSKLSKSSEKTKECAKPGDITVDQSLVSSIVISSEDTDITTTRYTIKLIIKNTSDKDARHFGVSDVLLSVSGLCALEDNTTVETNNKKSVLNPVTIDTLEEYLNDGHIIDPTHSVLKGGDVAIITYSITSLLNEPEITSLISQVNIESCGKFLSETKLPLKTSVSQYQSNPNNTVTGLNQPNSRAVIITNVIDISKCITLTGTDIGANKTHTILVNGISFGLALSNWVKKTGTNNYYRCNYFLSPISQGYVSSITATDNLGRIYLLSTSRTTSGTISLPVNALLQRTFTSLTFCILQCIPPAITTFDMVSPSTNPPQYQTGTSSVPMNISSTGSFSANAPLFLTVSAVNDATPTITSLLSFVSISSASAASGPFYANLGNLTCGTYTATLTLANFCGNVTKTAKFIMYNPLSAPASLTITPSPVPNSFPNDFYYVNSQSISLSIPTITPCVGTAIPIFGIQNANGNYVRGPSNTQSLSLNLLPGQYNVVAFTRLTLPAPGTFVDSPQITKIINVVKPIEVTITSDVTTVPSNGVVNFVATVSNGLPDNVSPITYKWYDDNTLVGITNDIPTFAYTIASVGTHNIKAVVSQPTLGNTTMTAESNIISVVYCNSPSLSISIPKGNYTIGDSIPLSASLTFTNPLTATLYYEFASSAPAQPYENSIGVNSSTSLYAIPVSTTGSLSGSYKIYAYTEVDCNGTILTSPVQTVDVALWNPVTITNTTPINIQKGTAFSQAITATGGTNTYSYGSGVLPDGLTLNSNSGIISGTPITSGNYTVNIIVADTQTGYVANKDIVFNIYDPLSAVISTSPQSPYIINNTYTITATPSGGLPQYSYSYIFAGPGGFSTSGNTNTFNFTPSATGNYVLQYNISDSNNTQVSPITTIFVQCPPVPSLTIDSPVSPNNTFLPTGSITFSGHLDSNVPVNIVYSIQNTSIGGTINNVISTFSETIDLTGFDLVDGTYTLSAYPVGVCSGVSGAVVDATVIVKTVPVITNLVATAYTVLSGFSTAFTASWSSAYPVTSFDWYLSTQLNAPYATTFVPGLVYVSPSNVTTPTTVSFTVRVNTNGGGSSAQYTPFVDILICPVLTATYQTQAPLYFPVTPSSNIQLFDLDVLITGRNVVPQITTLANTNIEGFYIGANVNPRFSLTGVTKIDNTHYKLKVGFDTNTSGNTSPSYFLVIGVRTFDCMVADLAIQPRFFEVKLYNPFTITSVTPIIAGVNVGISQKPLTVTGGTGSLSYEVDPSGDPLPIGFTLNSNTGNITGSFTGYSFSNVVIRVIDTIANQSATATVPIYPSIAVSNKTNFVAAIGVQTTITPFTVTVGSGNYTFALASGSLPSGITLNNLTGELSGTFTSNTFANVSISVNDNVTGQTATVNNILVYTSSFNVSLLSNFSSNKGDTQPKSVTPLSVSGGSGSYTYALAPGSPSIPIGVTLNNTTGVLSGTLSNYTNVLINIQVTDSVTSNIRTQNVRIYTPLDTTSAVQNSVISGSGSVYTINYTLNVTVDEQITILGGVGQYSISSVPTSPLPPGMSIQSSGNSFRLIGAITTPGIYNSTVRIEDTFDSGILEISVKFI